MRGSRVFTILLLGLSAVTAYGQQSGSVVASPPEPESKRILWIIPNFRTTSLPAHYTPLTSQEKFKIATEDSFDRGTVALGMIFGAQAQLTDSNPSFGQGARGCAHSIGTAFSDLVIGDYMTEAIFPSLLHQDPRYFRRGTGSGWSRFEYSAAQVFRTHSDSGREQFNYSEILGNSAAVAISMAYYPDGRDVQNGISKLGSQLAVDLASNVLKEFWPDLRRKFSHKEKFVNANHQ